MRPLHLLALASFLAASAGSAEDLAWTGWHGPDRDGRVPGFTPPSPWPDKLRQVWKVEVGSGYASPLVSAGRVYQHARQGGEEVLWCFDLDTGERVWRSAYPVPFEMGRGGERHGKGPKSSPALANGRLFTVSITGILSAWDADTGKLLWRRDFAEHVEKAFPYWGSAISPLVDEDRVIVHVGTCEQGVLLAIDAATGKDVWKQDQHAHCYSSPRLLDIEGVRQIVEWNHAGLNGIDRESGRILWEYPFPHRGQDQNMPTPAFHDGVIVAGGENRGIRAFAPRLVDGKWTVEEKWNTRDVSLDMCTAIMHDGLLYGLSHFKTGQLFCLDPGTGKVRWTGPPRAGENAMLLSVPGYVLALIDHGELQVIRASGERYQPMRRYQVADGGTWAPPVVLSNGFLVKDTAHLTRWELEAP